MTSRPERCQRGFTLLEMLVVLAVLGLGTAMLLTRGHGPSPALQARAAADAVTAALRDARGRAIRDDRTVTVAIDAAAHALRPSDTAPLPLPRAVALSAPGVIRFAPDGSSGGGSIVLAGGAERVLIRVDWLTGHVARGTAAR
ncbi:MAG: prepilin-type N-terminal cleavage/methylation domain-containing protein [Rhodospirillales bacterium]|nr:prepilin-type N-terminal cleavage/methylation domain-containing protein [Rhodospirillales bacterium]